MGRKVTTREDARSWTPEDPSTAARALLTAETGTGARSSLLPALAALMAAEGALVGLLSSSGNIPLLVLKAFRALLTF